ncbi:DEAD/DEAH box helicase [Synechococcus sp. PCC 7336]|uniref:DEAD/DEAH box helicase n=1 Tax=Synechococcus sp. PCC 7336 TaxID=195250 RepID=UPI00034D5CE5|nr:DEAD/DEAH box helicase [Synechococcus sp. PCC 7336]
MTDSATNADAIRLNLIEAYRQLKPLDKTIVQLFSVIYEPVSRSAFVTCFNQTGARDSQNRAFTAIVLRAHFQKLLSLGLLVQARSQGPRCHPLLAEVVTRDAIREGRFEAFARAIEETLPLSSYNWGRGQRYFSSQDQLVREVRIGLYRQDIEFINRQLVDYNKQGDRKTKVLLVDLFAQICNNPFDREWFRTLSLPIYELGLSTILASSSSDLQPADRAFALLQEGCTESGKYCSDVLRLTLAEQCLLRGRLSEAQNSLESVSAENRDEASRYWGWLTFVRGENDAAIAHFTEALKHRKQATRKRKIFLNGFSGLLFVLALLKDGSPQRLQEATTYAQIISGQSEHWLAPIYQSLADLLGIRQGELSAMDSILNAHLSDYRESHSAEPLFVALCLYWADADKAQSNSRLPKVLSPLYAEAKACGYDWLAMETAELLSKCLSKGQYDRKAAALRQDSGIQPLVDTVRSQQAWELCLNALANLQEPPKPANIPSAEKRLAWFVTFYPNQCVLQPREQKINARGVWSKGRPIALKRLHHQPGEFDYLTPQDLQVCACIETFTSYGSYGYRGSIDYTFSRRAIAALIGHPLVFWEDTPTIRVEVVKGEPELLVQKRAQDNRLILEFSPKIASDKDTIAIKETPTQIKVIEVTPEHHRIAEIIGQQNRLEVPALARERVLEAIGTVSRIVTVHSDIGGGAVRAEAVPAEIKPHIHLLPAGEGLKVAIFARPFADGGPYFRPGAGGETVIAEIGGQHLQTTRDLRHELIQAKAAVLACPTLARQVEQNHEWLVEEPEDCLELLMEFQELEDDVVLEWPQGEKLRVSHRANFDDFHLNIKKQRDWFAATGELKLDENSVLDMQSLLALLEKTPSRFVPLGDGQFLALTREFRRRLDEMRAFSEQHGKGVRFHPLVTPIMEELLDDVGQLKTDKHWKEQVKRIEEMQTLQPQLPSTLQAELRDYQLEGFNWLARLAYWGVGACLADDMGLGKTLQALAVILTRAPEGPTLIVAPTSVGANWMSEAQRFAPTLRAILFGSGDRQKMLEALQPFDMLVCSYGYLQQEEVAEMLAQVQWQTIVLDEAQAIKNFATKRSQAAMKLQAGFKVITTGTPIENHLGELWNLFRFINPGLLGSLERFNQRFAHPIERSQDKQARSKLKKLIQPFLLRRTKSQVLAELPSRTEILLHVDLSQEETALYEALRREAIAKLAESDGAAGPKHLQVLAEIMKLRRVCCNARLVVPDAPLPSAKLQLFGETIGELLENRHKVLVFSQFVDHLHILRDYLEERQIQYQYLDGSTPAKQRKQRVDAFQAGEGDVFLISLKAGGTGLNLTAADYVIHMDPWWNPAVEDQASDRAHRIGQQRPVTIYRLVAKDTIEEKIVSLHQQKRDLADSLLEGTDMSGKMSTDELLRLISE